jgi:hypothetical protein
MICPACRKDFLQPLETFDGRRFCPSCKKDIFPGEETALEITKENNAKMAESERLFGEVWLTGALKYSEADRRQALQSALRLSAEAAFLKNPYALVNAGYYFENGYMGRGRERFRSAYHYYSAVAFNKNDAVKIPSEYGGILQSSDYSTLKLRALKNLYSLLTSIPPEDASEIFGSEKNLEGKIEIAKKKLAEAGIVPEERREERAAKVLTPDSVFSAVVEGKNLFGIFRLPREDILALAEKAVPGKAGVEKKFGDFISDGKVKIKLASAKGEREAKLFRDVSSKRSLDAILNNDGKNQNFFLFFFNKEYEPARLKKREIGRILSALTADDDQTIQKFLNKGVYNGPVFGEDDVILFLDALKNYGAALEKLLAYASRY